VAAHSRSGPLSQLSHERTEHEMMADDDVLNLFAARKGHFLLESGHHGDLWLDLELLCLRPALVRPVVSRLADRLLHLGVEVVCGPLVEGAFVGLMVASEINAEFVYTERFARSQSGGLFPAGYRVPKPLRENLRRKRVAIVNDVINAGSAVRGTFADLQDCEATVVAIGAVLVLGTAASEFASAQNVILESIATLPNNLWVPSECPLCCAGFALEDIVRLRN
jgi:orotate phosphoribosyltransferase